MRANVRVLTVGHGTLTQDEFTALLHRSGVERLVDVRIAPGSKRHPHFGRGQMELWLPATGVEYRWEADLGGFRRPRADSPNVSLRNASFRGYADYMETEAFRQSLERLVTEASQGSLTVMCAETLWWRCHRRLIADACVLLYDEEVLHIGHDARLSAHRLTDGARLVEDRKILYAPENTAQQTQLLDFNDT